MAKQRLTDKSIVYLIKQRKIGKSTSDIAVEIYITTRHVRRLWSRFLNTKTIPKIRKPGRPTMEPSHVQTKSVLDMQNEENHMGVVRTVNTLEVPATIYPTVQDNEKTWTSNFSCKVKKMQIGSI